MEDALGLQRILDALAGACDSDLGAALAAQLGEAVSPAEAEGRLDLVDEARALLDRGLLRTLPEVLSVGDAVRHACRGAVLESSELRRIAAIVHVCDALRRHAPQLAPHAPSLATLTASLPLPTGLKDLGAELDVAFDDDGSLRDEASATLRRLRQEVRGLRLALRRRIGELVRALDQDGTLQDDYWTLRNDRVVLPVKAGERRAVEGIVHGSSGTGATIYVEPAEMVEQNNRLALATEAVRAEELRILAQFSAEVGVHGEALVAIADGLGALDFAAARARLAQTLGAHRPTFSADRLELRRARHPGMILDGVRVVANDIALQPTVEGRSAPRWLVVSGPNGGGKTVTLTTTGLAVAMARRGLPICAAEGSLVPFVDGVLLVIGDAQDLERGLSTFTGHLDRLRILLERCAAGGVLLVLIDELASGTEPAAGSALARAILLALADTASLGLITTHDEAVKLLASADDRFANAALALDDATATPTFGLRLHAVGSSNPLALAARVGLPAAIVADATRLLGAGGLDVTAALERLEAQRRESAREAEGLRHERQQLQLARERLDNQRRLEQLARDKRVAEASAAALAEVEAVRADLEDARVALATAVAGGGPPDAVEKWSRQMAARQRELRAGLQRRDDVGQPRPEIAKEAVVPGAEVYHPGLGRVVRVVEVDSRRGEARVQAGALEVRVELADLSPARPQDGIAAQPVARRAPRQDDDAAVFELGDRRGGRSTAKAEREAPLFGGGASAPESQAADAAATAGMRADDRTCDLRGMRADEAIAAADAFLDRAALRGVVGVTLVHGHGTGALRRAVEQHLRRHPLVAHSRLGGRGEGGDGATLVWLNGV